MKYKRKDFNNSSAALIMFSPSKSLDMVRQEVEKRVDKKYQGVIDMNLLTIFASQGCTYMSFYSEFDRLVALSATTASFLQQIRTANANADIAEDKRKQEEQRTLQEDEKLIQEKKATLEKGLQEEQRTRAATFVADKAENEAKFVRPRRHKMGV